MVDQDNEELNRLRGLVVKLSKEIDYKNHLLMQKDGLSLEKFATMSCLMEEKERLLVERSEVIGALMAQNHRLNEAYTKGMQDFEQVKLELKKVKHELEVEKRKQYRSTGELVTYQGETDQDRLGLVTTTHLSTGDKVNEQSLVMIEMMDDKERVLKRLDDATAVKEKLLKEIYSASQLMVAPVAEKDKLFLLENCKADFVGKRVTECMKKQTKQLQERKGDQVMTIKTESVDYDLGSSSFPVNPPRKKSKVSKS